VDKILLRLWKRFEEKQSHLGSESNKRGMTNIRREWLSALPIRWDIQFSDMPTLRERNSSKPATF
jgi:hypothetical protein